MDKHRQFKQRYSYNAVISTAVLNVPSFKQSCLNLLQASAARLYAKDSKLP